MLVRFGISVSALVVCPLHPAKSEGPFVNGNLIPVNIIFNLIYGQIVMFCEKSAYKKTGYIISFKFSLMSYTF